MVGLIVVIAILAIAALIGFAVIKKAEKGESSDKGDEKNRSTINRLVEVFTPRKTTACAGFHYGDRVLFPDQGRLRIGTIRRVKPTRAWIQPDGVRELVRRKLHLLLSAADGLPRYDRKPKPPRHRVENAMTARDFCELEDRLMLAAGYGAVGDTAS